MNTSSVVHLVDDDESCLRSTARMLTVEGFPIAAFSSGAGLLEAISPVTRGCIVADLGMPGMNGLELQARLTRCGVLMPVVFLSGQGDIPATVRAMQGGAVDFIEKLAPREQLFAAIRRALERDAAEHGQRARAAELRGRFDGLSRREQEVLREVMRGQMNKQIAATLRISERTVKLHRTSIKTKIGEHSVARIAALARDAGWTGGPPGAA